MLILNINDELKSSEDYDKLVSAEIPDQKCDPELYETVTKCMIHAPCHVNKDSVCLNENKICTKGFPKNFVESTESTSDSYPLYKRPNNGQSLMSKGVRIDNRSVVPYIPTLCKKYNAHINVEICNSITAVKYLYKYVYKGHDKALVQFINNDLDKQVFNFFNLEF